MLMHKFIAFLKIYKNVFTFNSYPTFWLFIDFTNSGGFKYLRTVEMNTGFNEPI